MSERLRKPEAPIDIALRKIIATYPHTQARLSIQFGLFKLMIANGEMPTSLDQHDYLDLAGKVYEITSKYVLGKPHKSESKEDINKDALKVIENLQSAIESVADDPLTDEAIETIKIEILDKMIYTDDHYQDNARPNRGKSGEGRGLLHDKHYSFIVNYGIDKKPTGSAAIDSVYAYLPQYVKDKRKNKELQTLLKKYNLNHPLKFTFLR